MRQATRTPGRQSSIGRRAHAILTPLAAVLLLVASVAPAAAAQTTDGGRWSQGTSRPVTQRHVPSVRIAAAAAARSPRGASARTAGHVHGTVKIAHPAIAGAAPFPAAVASRTGRPLIASPPDVAVAGRFAGLAQVESGDWVPPDPWVAVNPTYVVQSVNSMLRISNRAGAEILSVPIWALFSLPYDQLPFDARVIWDRTHGRWVAVAMSITSDGSFSLDFLNLAISDTADPSGAWTIQAVPYVDSWLDYPSLATSNDKVVVAANLFDPDGAFLAAELTTFTWSSILAGGAVTLDSCADPTYAYPRAAQVLSPGDDVQLILESTLDAHQWYWRLTGVGACGEIVDGTDLTSTLGFSAFAVPPDPRQPPGDVLVDAVNEKPTDAIFGDGSLWWVSTFPYSYDAGASVNDAVVLWNAIVDPTTHDLTVGNPQVISAGDGIDDFVGGIGLSADGTLFAVYSESSSADAISLQANRVPAGGALGTPIEIDGGDGSVDHERWGDFAGVATDPVGTGTAWATHEVAAADGTWRTVVARLIVDGDIPTTPGAPGASVVVPSILTGSASVRISWTPATDAASGAVTYQVDQSVDGAAFGTPSTVAGRSIGRPLLIGHTYRFEVRAVDAVGNAGGWSVGPTVRPYLYQQTSGTAYSGTWRTSTRSAYSGGSVRYASTAGRSATFTATAARSIAIVTTRAPSRGSFKVYVDGVYRATVSTWSSATRYRQIIYSYSWSTPGTHRIRIVVRGTAGHPRVDLDAFIVLK